MTQDQYIKLGKAIRKSLQIGDKVLIIPTQTHGTRVMFVRELHNPKTAGLSRTKNSTIYGIDYSIIHPL